MRRSGGIERSVFVATGRAGVVSTRPTTIWFWLVERLARNDVESKSSGTGDLETLVRAARQTLLSSCALSSLRATDGLLGGVLHLGLDHQEIKVAVLTGLPPRVRAKEDDARAWWGSASESSSPCDPGLSRLRRGSRCCPIGVLACQSALDFLLERTEPLSVRALVETIGSPVAVAEARETLQAARIIERNGTSIRIAD
jgi:hypothetical protein